MKKPLNNYVWDNEKRIKAKKCSVCGKRKDKIRAEIDRQEKWLLQAGYNTYNVNIAFDAIKAVSAESEG